MSSATALPQTPSDPTPSVDLAVRYVALLVLVLPLLFAGHFIFIFFNGGVHLGPGSSFRPVVLLATLVLLIMSAGLLRFGFVLRSHAADQLLVCAEHSADFVEEARSLHKLRLVRGLLIGLTVLSAIAFLPSAGLSVLLSDVYRVF